jgi:ribosomal protein S12 methylthiotransferase
MVSLPIVGGRPRTGDPAVEPKKVYFVSLGCPKNQVDTEVMLGVVRAGGHTLVDDPALADTLVVNTCGFIDAAKEESIETILELARVKAGADDRKRLVVAGCLSQRYPTELAEEMPEVDFFLGSADMLGLEKVLGGSAARMGVSELGRRSWLYDHSTPRQTYGAGHSNYVKIAEGCDRPCGFCIIPKLRGPQRSRPVFDVVQEVHALVEQGTREVCLVAQDLTTYGTDLVERGLAPAN